MIRIALVICAVTLFASAGPLWAQPAEEIDWTVRYWAEAGPSMTTLGLGTTGGIGVEFGRNVLSLRGNSTDPTWGQQTWDVSVLYGRAYHMGSFALTGGAGVSVVGGRSFDGIFLSDESESISPMLGFPLDGRAEWFPSNAVAVGLHTFVNVNTAQPFGGFGVLLRFGNLR